MNFSQASQEIDTLVSALTNATSTTEIADAKAALSDFYVSELSITNAELRPLRQVVIVVLDEYKDAVVGPELASIKTRTAAYKALIAKFKLVNSNLAGTPELAPILASATNLVKLSNQAVSTIKSIKEAGIESLDPGELAKIDELLELLVQIPEREVDLST